MRVVTRYSVIFFPSSCISKSATRAHLKPRTVLAASATAFSAALAKLSLEAPTMSMTFCAMFASLQGLRSILANVGPEWDLSTERLYRNTKLWRSASSTYAWCLTLFMIHRSAECFDHCEGNRIDCSG